MGCDPNADGTAEGIDRIAGVIETNMIRELVLATRNRHKGGELAALLGDLGIRIRILDEFPETPEVIEDGETCEANAVKKARAIADATGLPAVADDTGLEVDALGGRPGVFAARYAGEAATYEDNCRKLLYELGSVPRERRTARFVTVAAMAFPGDGVQIARGVLEGLIAEGPSGTQGFGYDPVFFVPELGRTLAQLSADQKNRISHRAKAFAKVRQLLQDSARVTQVV
jgi:XTP/dITP diphosphohydrolase